MACSFYRGKIVRDKGPFTEAVDELTSAGCGDLGTPFQELLLKLQELAKGETTVEMLPPDSEGTQHIFISSSEENEMWVCISSNGRFEIGYPGQ